MFHESTQTFLQATIPEPGLDVNDLNKLFQ